MSSPETTPFIVRGDDGDEYGPVDLTGLREWVRENRAGLGTSVRRDEPGAPWRPWQAYPELVALLAEAQATGELAPGGTMIIAPLPRRMFAFALDLVLIAFLILPLMRIAFALCPPAILMQLEAAVQSGNYVSVQLPVFYYLLFNGIVYGVVVLYLAGFHWAHGQTPAKTLLRLRVVDRNGRKPEGWRALLRSLVLCLSILPWFLPFFFVFFNPQRRALHDLAAGTCVVEA
jgi:uncharacterized RDD family membrane protein YckC